MKEKKSHGGKRAGAGRKEKEADKKAAAITVTVPPDLLALLDELREREGWNRSQAVTEALRVLLGKNP